VDAYVQFWNGLSWVEWLLLGGVVAALLLVTFAAAAWGNPTRVNLARRPVPLPDKRPGWAAGQTPSRSSAPYAGRHRTDDQEEKTINLWDQRRDLAQYLNKRAD
jgi:hypothetical protein